MARIAVGLLAAVAALLAPAPHSTAAEGESAVIQPANNDIGNVASLQRGAKYFVNYCLGCHSATYVRYNRLAEDLGITEEQLIENLMFTGERPHDTMISAMSTADAVRWFGTAPPDLSLIARSRGTDWIYSYLKSFYLDDDRPTGTNNLVLEGTAMPHVLWELQGWQKPAVHQAGGDAGLDVAIARLEPVVEGMLSAEEYDRVVRDVANFLEYLSEPVQLERRRLGIRVILFLLVFLLVAYMLKKEYWKQVH
ncbi:MAG TPA: cytochrome c1 [Gammaproteobacteria bacterium]|nr:cytochrome c1 [Gammaproteobacteria bacterium]